MAWTQEMVDHLTTRWREQTSATELAHELSGMAGRAVTRNAVLGKVHRLGLTGAGAKPHHTRPAQDKRGRAVAAPASVGVLPAEVRTMETEQVTPAAPVALGGVPLFPEGPASLPMIACRWPLWGKTHTGMVCGATCKDGKPYCADHCRIAYQPPAERKPGEKKRVAA